MSDRITPEHITLKRAAELYPASVRNMREHCRPDHPIPLKHFRGPGGHIFVLPKDVEDWMRRKGEDWKLKRRKRDE